MIQMDNIHGGSWKKLQNWATGLFLKKTADSDLNMNGNDITNAGNLYTQAQVNSTFMKKTADSDLNMNGHDVNNIDILSSTAPVGTSSKLILVPHITNSNIGLNSSATFENFFTAYAKYIYDSYVGEDMVSFSGTFTKSGYGHGDIRGFILANSADVDENGIPIVFNLIATLGKGEVFYCYRYGASDPVHLEKFDTNFDVNGARTADLDMNGCSMLLTKRMQSILGSGAQTTSFIVTPYYNTTSSNVSEAITNWLKNLCIDFKNLSTVLAFGMPDYSGRHSILASLYNTIDTDSNTGIPRYGSGIFIPIAENKIYKFQILNYVLAITSVSLS